VFKIALGQPLKINEVIEEPKEPKSVRQPLMARLPS